MEAITASPGTFSSAPIHRKAMSCLLAIHDVQGLAGNNGRPQQPGRVEVCVGSQQGVHYAESEGMGRVHLELGGELVRRLSMIISSQEQ